MGNGAELVRICHMVHERGLVAGSGGNISILQSSKSLLITPTGRSLGLLTEEDLALADMQGQALGDNKPSKEALLHALVYLTREDCKAVVHVHSPHAVAVSCLKDLDTNCAIPIYTPGYNARVANLRSIPFFPPGSRLLAENIAEVVRDVNAVLLRNHGLITVGSTLEQAVNLAEEIEESCMMFFLLGDRGQDLMAAMNDTNSTKSN